jgi:hypothetical protein
MKNSSSSDNILKKKEISPESGSAEGAGKAEIRRLLHQFNQPLTAISNYAQAGSHLIDNGLEDPARLKELFDKIVAQCNRTFVLSQELGEAAGR